MTFRTSVRSVSPIEFLVTFLPFVALLFIAIFTAEQFQDRLHHAVINSARATMILFTATISLYALPDRWPQRENYWLLLWTFSFISYLIHLYFSLIQLFHGGIGSIFRAQGTWMAATNLLITAWWLFDVTLAWMGDADGRWVRIERTGLHILILGVFFVMTVMQSTADGKQPLVLFLGLLQMIAVLASLAFRWWSLKNPPKTRIKTG